jgi:hypothetical protein
MKNIKLPPIAEKRSADKLRNESPLVHGSLARSGTVKGLKKIVFSDKKVTRFAGLKIVIGENEKADVI